MEMELNVPSFASILAVAEPFLRQFLVFNVGLLLLAFPSIVFRVRPFAIPVAEYRKGPITTIAFLVLCGGLSGVLISYELVRSYGFSPLWQYALPAVSAASVYFQYVGGRCSGMIRALSHNDSDVRKAAAETLGRLGDRRAIDPLIKLIGPLSDKYYWDVRDTAKAAFNRLRRQEPRKLVNRLIQTL